MTNLHHPLRLNVGFLISAAIGTDHDFEFDFEKMRLGEELILCDFIGKAHFNRTPQGLLLQGNFRGGMDLECVRCLSNFSRTLEWEQTDLYAFNQRSVSESNLLVPEDGYIDLEPLLREYALLEVPISPICRPDCIGLCPVCGQNLNEADCGHRAESNNSFAVLKDILG
jgi:uncharacterized protein